MASPNASQLALVIGDGATSAVRSAVRAAQSCVNSGKLDLLLFGTDAASNATKAAEWEGINKVYACENDSPVTAEIAAPCIQAQIESGDYGHVIAPANTFGKNVIPRVAGAIGVSSVSDVIEIREDSDVFVRPIYAGNALATVRSREEIKLLTVRSTAFEPISNRSSGLAEVVRISAASDAVHTRWVSDDKSASTGPDLSSAGVVIAGGRGLKSSDNFKILEEIAQELGGAVGATRAAVDLGYVANDLQVGQTGKIVAPELYIAVGVSGAIQHLAGMKDSKTIVAINKDADAPIFQVADYGLVADLFDAMPELKRQIKALPKRDEK